MVLLFFSELPWQQQHCTIHQLWSWAASPALRLTPKCSGEHRGIIDSAVLRHCLPILSAICSKKKEQIRLRRRKKLCKNTSFPPEGGVQSTFAAAFWKERLFNAERLNEERSRASGSLPQITPQPAPRGRRRCRSDVWQGQQAPQGERRCAFGSRAWHQQREVAPVTSSWRWEQQYGAGARERWAPEQDPAWAAALAASLPVNLQAFAGFLLQGCMLSGGGERKQSLVSIWTICLAWTLI